MRIVLSTSFMILINFCTLFSCQNAKYNVVHNDKVSPTPIPCKDGETEIAGVCVAGNNGLPTARVIVLKDSLQITKAAVGETLDITPSKDTFDFEDLTAVDRCQDQPGIVRVAYKIDDELLETVTRKKCESLAIKNVFTQPGVYKINMVVFTNENDTAESTMTLAIGQADQNFAGFMIQGPVLGKTNESLEYSGICKTNESFEISWEMGDGNTTKGDKINYVYDKKGQYLIIAECKTSTQKYLAALTVVITDSKVNIDDKIDCNQNPSHAKCKTNCEPGQKDCPSQTDNSQNKPGQNTTGQNATGQNSTEQNTTGQSSTEQNATGQNATGQNKSE